MGAFNAKPEKKPTTSIQAASIPNAGADSSEKNTAQLDAFWAGALKSASILLWIVTHSPNPEQSPFL